MKNFNKLALAVFAVALALVSCEKEKTTVEPTETLPDYYLNLNYQGQQYKFDKNRMQVGHSSIDEFGGWSTEGDLFYGDAIKINFVFDTATDSLDLQDVLVGKRIYFNGYSGPYPSVNMVLNFGEDYFYDEQVNNPAYYVEVTEVEFLRTEDGLFNWDVYAVRGTFNASLEDGNGGYTDAIGDFYFQMTHDNLD